MSVIGFEITAQGGSGGGTSNIVFVGAVNLVNGRASNNFAYTFTGTEDIMLSYQIIRGSPGFLSAPTPTSGGLFNVFSTNLNDQSKVNVVICIP